MAEISPQLAEVLTDGYQHTPEFFQKYRGTYLSALKKAEAAGLGDEFIAYAGSDPGGFAAIPTSSQRSNDLNRYQQQVTVAQNVASDPTYAALYDAFGSVPSQDSNISTSNFMYNHYRDQAEAAGVLQEFYNYYGSEAPPETGGGLGDAIWGAATDYGGSATGGASELIDSEEEFLNAAALGTVIAGGSMLAGAGTGAATAPAATTSSVTTSPATIPTVTTYDAAGNLVAGGNVANTANTINNVANNSSLIPGGFTDAFKAVAPWAAAAYGNYQSAEAAKDAANIQAQSGREAIAAAEAAEARARADRQPFLDFGSSFMPQLQERMSGDTEQVTYDTITQDKLFQNLYGEAKDDINAMRAAGSKLGTGDRELDYINASLLTGGNLVNQRLNRERQKNVDLYNLVTMGSNAATGNASNAITTGANVADLQTQIGNVNAAGQIAQGNIVSDTITQGIGLYDLLNDKPQSGGRNYAV